MHLNQREFESLITNFVRKDGARNPGATAGIMVVTKPVRNLEDVFELYNDIWDAIGNVRRALSRLP